MNKKILKVFAVIPLLFILLLVLAYFQPNEFQISRSIEIQGPAEKIFPFINNFRLWNEWSPWAKIDPQMNSQYEGPDFGPGAIYKWSGNSDVGQGQMTLVKSTEPSMVLVELKFEAPMQATNFTTFEIQPTASTNTSIVIWTMSGKNAFISKIIHVFFSTDRMIGPSFEKGLTQLKTVVESKQE